MNEKRRWRRGVLDLCTVEKYRESFLEYIIQQSSDFFFFFQRVLTRTEIVEPVDEMLFSVAGNWSINFQDSSAHHPFFGISTCICVCIGKKNKPQIFGTIWCDSAHTKGVIVVFFHLMSKFALMRHQPNRQKMIHNFDFVSRFHVSTGSSGVRL